MKRVLYIVGGLAAFSAFGLWLGHRGEPDRTTRYSGHVTHVCPSQPRCVRVERVRVGKVYVWQCAESGEHRASGNLAFRAGGAEHLMFNLPGDSLDLWGAVQVGADRFELRMVDVAERLP